MCSLGVGGRGWGQDPRASSSPGLVPLSLGSGCWGRSQGFGTREKTGHLEQSPKLSPFQRREEEAPLRGLFSLGTNWINQGGQSWEEPLPSFRVTLSIFGVSRSNQISRLGSAHSRIYRLRQCCYTSILINPDTGLETELLGGGEGRNGGPFRKMNISP